MLERHDERAPIACSGLSPMRPFVFWGSLTCNLLIWIGLALLAYYCVRA